MSEIAGSPELFTPTDQGKILLNAVDALGQKAHRDLRDAALMTGAAGATTVLPICLGVAEVISGTGALGRSAGLGFPGALATELSILFKLKPALKEYALAKELRRTLDLADAHELHAKIPQDILDASLCAELGEGIWGEDKRPNSILKLIDSRIPEDVIRRVRLAGGIKFTSDMREIDGRYATGRHSLSIVLSPSEENLNAYRIGEWGDDFVFITDKGIHSDKVLKDSSGFPAQKVISNSILYSSSSPNDTVGEDRIEISVPHGDQPIKATAIRSPQVVIVRQDIHYPKGEAEDVTQCTIALGRTPLDRLQQVVFAKK